MDQTIVVLSALLLNAALGGPRRWYAALGAHRLTAWPGRTVRHLERKLNREHRSAADREFRGWLLVGAALIGCLIAGVFGMWLFRHNLRFVELILVATLLPVRPIWDRASTIRQCLAAGDIPGARQALIGTPWRHHALLDEFGLARAACETTAVDFSEKLVAPMIAYLWLGLPGLFFCKLITLMRDALSHAPDFSKGTCMAHLCIHAVPSRLSAALWLVASAFLPSADFYKAVGHVWKPLCTAAPRALCVHAAAAAVRVSLGGPTSPYLSTWSENGPAKATVPDVRRAQAVYVFAMIVLFVCAGAFF